PLRAPAQLLGRLGALERRGRIRPGNLDHGPRAFPDNRLHVVSEPRPPHPLGRSRERVLRRGGRGHAGRRDPEHRQHPAGHRLSTSRWYTPFGSPALVTCLPTTRWVAPRCTASAGVTVRRGSAV